MYFYVTFRTKTKEEKLIEYIGDAGIDILDDLREAVPFIKSIPVENIDIDTSCPITRYKTTIALSETKARESKHFGGRTGLEVVVPSLFLSRFVDWETKKEHSTKEYVRFIKTRRVIGVRCSQRLDEDKLYQVWKEKGYPLDWQL